MRVQPCHQLEWRRAAGFERAAAHLHKEQPHRLLRKEAFGAAHHLQEPHQRHLLRGGRNLRRHLVHLAAEQAEEKAQSLKKGEVLLLENLRFHKEETDGDLKFAEALSNF